MRVLGVEYFGLLAFATATVVYFNIITDYGFSLTATREISIHRENREKIVEIFSSVMSIKVLLMFLSFFLLVILVFSFDKFSKDWEIYFFTFGTVVGQTLFPIWFFQGMERMKYITYLNILSKSIFTVAIFIFVKEQSDFYIVPILTSVGFIVAGILSLWIIKKEFDIGFKFQTLQTLKYYFVDGFHIFIANLSGNLYGQGSTIILGLFTNYSIVGYYSFAQKLASALASIFQVFAQAYFPYIVKLKEINFNNFIKTCKAIILKTSFFIAFIIGTSLIFSDKIYKLISGIDNPIGYYSFSFWLIITIFTIYNVLLNPIIVVLKEDVNMSKMYLFVGVSFLLYGILLTTFFSYKGMLASMLIVEILIFIFSFLIIRKGIIKFKRKKNAK